MPEPRRRKRWKLFLVIFLALLALTGGAAFSQRSQLETWYYAYRLEHAAEAERQVWADKLVARGEAAVPRLLASLSKDDVHLCATVRASLGKLLAEWGAKDPRCEKLVDRFFEAQPSFSPAGQIAALQLLPELLAVGGPESSAKARTIVSAALRDRAANQRIKGIFVALSADLNLLPAIVPLLNDPEPEVRLAALAALGPIKEGNAGVEQPLVSTEDLLHWLHDPEPEVRKMCKEYLRGRGLRDHDIRLGKMLTDPEPMERLALLLDLADEDELKNVGAWLKRLSNDSDPAVRAGATRVAAERKVDFVDRLEEMINHDPDSTVRKIAAHYRKLYR